MRHLIISREFPPASYPAGGIGTYAANIARLLAEAGDTVHVIGERWEGASLEREERNDGRLVIHRVASHARDAAPALAEEQRAFVGDVACPAQWFAWHAALLAESLVSTEGIDVIEGQDYEAPLYYLLGRRARGLGPARTPPCVVHLHSPTAFIFDVDGYVPHRPEQLTAMRMEQYCIAAADAWLCPSRYMTREMATRYGVPPDEVVVIPYPVGDIPLVERDDTVWRDDRFVYVGRLEPRKGVLEFIDAAITVARTEFHVSFDFIGADVQYGRRASVQDQMQRRIPPAFRERFRFHGALPRERLPTLLARACAAVVPSRSENFPNSCIEAMGSGLPVLVSPTGGMAEMIDDGVTGWIAPSQSALGLTVALQRAVRTPPAIRADMGRAAANAIRQRCGNDVVVQQQLDARRAIVARGAMRSIGRATVGATVPPFVPVRHAPALSVRDILGFPPRQQLQMAMDALRTPRRTLAWLWSVLGGGSS